MNTQDFICNALGCTERECEFLDTLFDEFPSFGDFDDSVITDFNPNWGRLVNYLVWNLFDEVVYYYTQKGLDESLFSQEINSVCSCLTYCGKNVTEKDLEELVNE